MIKKIAAASAAVLMMAGVASAAAVDVNMYGASAQYLFWTGASADFLTDMGCSGVTTAESGEKSGLATGTACTGLSGNDVTIRYTAKASFDGVMAAGGTEHIDAPTTCTDKSQRPMITSVADTPLSCQKVHIGASDVAAESFSQTSFGAEEGPLGGAFVMRDFVTNPVTADGLATANPLVVPFAPFVSKNVKASTCDDGANAGEYCDSVADCGAGATSCTAKPLDNLSREMVVNIFSGYISNWSDFGPGFPNQPMTVCLRHAGSGTHATIDHAVMNKTWGAGLVSFENPFSAPFIYFNDGSSDMMKCVTNNKTTDADESTWFAIGYADADYLIAKPEYAPYTYSPKYNGAKATRSNIKNGLYDWWSAQWMYYNPTQDQAILDTIAALVNYSSDSANLPAAKADYWASQSEMNFFKGNDLLYPTKQ